MNLRHGLRSEVVCGPFRNCERQSFSKFFALSPYNTVREAVTALPAKLPLGCRACGNI
jgi:hypothetical protein